MSDIVRESTPLLSEERRSNPIAQYENDAPPTVSPGLLWRLYVSHFLSTWNMRSYEFTVILLFAKAYPDTLLPTSVRGILTNGATLLLSPALGRWVDRNASKFGTIRSTIVIQRICIVLACALWVAVFAGPTTKLQHDISASQSQSDGLPTWSSDTAGSPFTEGHGGIRIISSKTLLICLIIVFSVIERVCAVGNTLVMERDWIPTIAQACQVSDPQYNFVQQSSSGDTSGRQSPPLHVLNARMKRIDLISKVLAPVLVSTVAVAATAKDWSGEVVLACVTAVLNLTTVGFELGFARETWRRCEGVLQAKRADGKREYAGLDTAETGRTVGEEGQEMRASTDVDDTLRSVAVQEKQGPLALYFNNPVWLASMSMALQSFSVLSLSGPMTTYLLIRHYSLSLITTARTLTSILEIGSTLLFPLAASFISCAQQSPQRQRRGLLKLDSMTTLAFLGISLQVFLLIPCLISLLLVPLPSPSTNPNPSPTNPASLYPLLTTFIFLFLGLSRIGAWTHNIAVQQLVQTQVEASHRVEFSGVEMTFVSGAEIGRWVVSGIWGTPEDFGGVAVMGLLSVVWCWGLMSGWIWRVWRRARRR